MAPQITACAQAAAHITTRKNHSFLTQVAWRGENAAPRETTENVREGLAATVSGRPIDQGVLVQLVIEDTEVRSVHTLNLPDPARPRVASSTSDNDGFQIVIERVEAVDLNDAITQVAGVSEMPNSSGAFCPAFCPFAFEGLAIKRLSLDPSVKAACCAEDGACAADSHPVHASSGSDTKQKWSPSPARCVQVQVPEIGRAEIAGEWLIPRDEILLVGLGPHTVADKDGKAVVRERVAMITATEVAMPAVDATSEPLALPRPMPRVARTPLPSPSSPSPTPSSPPLPSRSLPQGIHADGTPAELPPLPDDEKATPGDESAEPRPSAQKHKAPSTVPPAAKPATSSDTKATKATFTLPTNLFKQAVAPALGLPNLQFMMPLKPFELKLPFCQKLQLELIGRIVADTDPAPDSSDSQ